MITFAGTVARSAGRLALLGAVVALATTLRLASAGLWRLLNGSRR